MKITNRAILPIIIALVSLFYGVLDYSGTIDRIQGREDAMRIWERLSTVPSGDSVVIFAEFEPFSQGMPFIIAHSRNEQVQEAAVKGIRATAIARIGGIARPPGTEDYPAYDTVVRFYASPSSPIMIGYNYTYDDRDRGWGFSLGCLGEIPQWVEESRSRERFIVYTLLIGILSIVVAVQEANPVLKKLRPNGGNGIMRLSTVVILTGSVAALIIMILLLAIFWLPKLDSTAMAGIIGVLSGGAIALLTTLVNAVFEVFVKSRESERRFQESVSQQALELTRMDYEMRMKGNQRDFLAPAKVYREFFLAIKQLQNDGQWPKNVEAVGLLNIFSTSEPDSETGLSKAPLGQAGGSDSGSGSQEPF